LLDNFGCLFGFDLSLETKAAAADSIGLQLKDLVVVPTEVDLGQSKQSLSCKNQTIPFGNKNERLFADPGFSPVIVLFCEDDDNTTAVVVL
jgi:hypothetical protein